MSEQKITEREAFEAALVEWWPQAKGNLNFDDGEYSNHFMNYAWWGWQASQKHRAASHDVAEANSGWKLVPVEPTKQMMSQGHFAMAGTDRGKFRRIYMAMVAAAPEVQIEN